MYLYTLLYDFIIEEMWLWVVSVKQRLEEYVCPWAMSISKSRVSHTWSHCCYSSPLRFTDHTAQGHRIIFIISLPDQHHTIQTSSKTCQCLNVLLTIYFSVLLSSLLHSADCYICWSLSWFLMLGVMWWCEPLQMISQCWTVSQWTSSSSWSSLHSSLWWWEWSWLRTSPGWGRMGDHCWTSPGWRCARPESSMRSMVTITTSSPGENLGTSSRTGTGSMPGTFVERDAWTWCHLKIQKSTDTSPGWCTLVGIKY